jgi:hypothetical protein
MASTMKFAQIPFGEVFFDYARNFRMGNGYAECEPIPNFNPEKMKANLYESVKEEGVHTPFAVVELEADEAKALSERLGRKVKYRCIRGHRRGKVVENIHHHVGPHILQTIPCNVYKGVSNEDEYRLMVDQVHVKGLNDYELFDAIRKLAMNTRLSEEQIGVQIGKSRGYVQRRKWIMGLPPVVEDNYRRRYEVGDDGKPVSHISFTDTDLNELNKAANRDREAGRDPASNDSEFNRQWDKLATTGKAKDNEPKAWTRKEILDKIQWIKEPIVKTVMLACAGDPVRLTDAVEQVEALRAQIAQLTDQVEALKSNVA